MSDLEKLLRAAFVVSAFAENGCYLGDMSAKVALAELAAKDAEIAELRELVQRADGAIQKAAMALGSTDEWADQGTMIADFEKRLSTSLSTIKVLRNRLGLAREYCERELDTLLGDSDIQEVTEDLAKIDAALEMSGGVL